MTETDKELDPENYLYTVYKGLIQIAMFYGYEHQLEKVSEECMELADAITAYIADPNPKNKRAMLDEFADVLVTTGQFRKVLFAADDNDFVNERILFKVNRQLKRMRRSRSSNFMLSVFQAQEGTKNETKKPKSRISNTHQR